MVYSSVTELRAAVGTVVGTSDWLEVTQERIDGFAHATGDLQWIHTDPERAAKGPFGSTIAHGFLTLSLIPGLAWGMAEVEGASMAVNYGLNKVRFPAPVPVGSRVRAVVQLLSVDDVARIGDVTGIQVVSQVTVEREGGDKPVCVAETVSRVYF